jgi:sirohydrochlorin ferrochelatase
MNKPTPNAETTAVIIVDHGSRRAESNAMLEVFVERFRARSSCVIVEPAHMELAEPSVAEAFDRCVDAGARRVVVIPYFLLPGRHWEQDIPRLAAEAASRHPGIEYLVGAPIGLHPMMVDVVQARLDHCLAHAAGDGPACDACEGTGRCVMQRADRDHDSGK